MTEEVVLMKGNEAIAHAAIRLGVDGYFGYPITPQSEVLETLAEQKPWETTGMVVLQAESEVAAINMVYGGAGAGKMVMTSSSSPGVSLKQEGISYIAGAELPCLIVNVMRGGSSCSIFAHPVSSTPAAARANTCSFLKIAPSPRGIVRRNTTGSTQTTCHLFHPNITLSDDKSCPFLWGTAAVHRQFWHQLLPHHWTHWSLYWYEPCTYFR